MSPHPVPRTDATVVPRLPGDLYGYEQMLPVDD